MTSKTKMDALVVLECSTCFYDTKIRRGSLWKIQFRCPKCANKMKVLSVLEVNDA